MISTHQKGLLILAREGMLHLAGHLRAEEWNGTFSAGFAAIDAAPF